MRYTVQDSLGRRVSVHATAPVPRSGSTVMLVVAPAPGVYTKLLTLSAEQALSLAAELLTVGGAQLGRSLAVASEDAKDGTRSWAWGLRDRLSTLLGR